MSNIRAVLPGLAVLLFTNLSPVPTRSQNTLPVPYTGSEIVRDGDAADEWLCIRRDVAAGKIEIEVPDEMRLPVEAALVDVSGKVMRQFSIRQG